MFYSEKGRFDINPEQNPEGSGYVLHTLSPNEGVPVDLSGAAQNPQPRERSVLHRVKDSWEHIPPNVKTGLGMAGIALGTAFAKRFIEEKTGMHWFDTGASIAFQATTFGAVTATYFENSLRSRGWEKPANALGWTARKLGRS